MLGKTHFFVGMAAALAVYPPQTMPILVAGTAAAALGGVIPDIDSGTSEAHKDADKIIGVATAIVAAAVVADCIFHIGIYRRIRRDSNVYRVVMGGLFFLVICAFGKNKPHRSFMHSVLALLLLGACVNIVFPDVAKYFGIGFVSHLCIDLLNRRRVRLLWPFGRGFCLRLCSADGVVNRCMMTVAAAADIIFIMTSLPVVRAFSAVKDYLPL